MDKITQEVEKYNRRKDRLAQSFMVKMRGIVASKTRHIEQTTVVIKDLEEKRNSDQNDLDRAKLAIQTHR